MISVTLNSMKSVTVNEKTDMDLEIIKLMDSTFTLIISVIVIFYVKRR